MASTDTSLSRVIVCLIAAAADISFQRCHQLILIITIQPTHSIAALVPFLKLALVYGDVELVRVDPGCHGLLVKVCKLLTKCVDGFFI
jgi:hypothetical protein